MNVLYVVGVGPGDPELITVKALRLVQEADVVAGFSTVLEVVRKHVRGQVLPLTYRDQEEKLGQLAEAASRGMRCVLCAWGDPSVSAQELVERVQRVYPWVEIVAGVSSLAVACARVGAALEESLFISLHRREGAERAFQELVYALKQGHRHVFVFPRPYDLMPAQIAQRLMAEEIPPETRVVVLERLGLPEERVLSLSLGALTRCDTLSDLTILFFPKEDEGGYGDGQC